MNNNILSLFDGISCGQIALNRLGIKYDKYFASEIDKYAIQITQKNYPSTVQVGDIRELDGTKYKGIKLLTGGFPCQSFSIAGNGKGFDDSRGTLFYELLRVLKQSQPKYFLFENVASMKKKDQEYISQQLGVEPIMINSALVSAQQRKRLYWTNIPNIIQPKDKNIYLKDIIESGYVDRDKSYCIDACYYKGTNLEQYLKKKRRQIVYDNNNTRKQTPTECEILQTLPRNYTAGVSNTRRYMGIGNGWTVDVIVHILKNMER